MIGAHLLVPIADAPVVDLHSINRLEPDALRIPSHEEVAAALADQLAHVKFMTESPACAHYSKAGAK